MERMQVRETLQHILEDETDSTLGALHDEMILAEQFELDSMDYVSLIMRIEESFHIRLTNDELSRVVTIGSLVDLVANKLGEVLSLQTSRRAA